VSAILSLVGLNGGDQLGEGGARREGAEAGHEAGDEVGVGAEMEELPELDGVEQVG
jgi:hypothetical protein